MIAASIESLDSLAYPKVSALARRAQISILNKKTSIIGVSALILLALVWGTYKEAHGIRFFAKDETDDKVSYITAFFRIITNQAHLFKKEDDFPSE